MLVGSSLTFVPSAGLSKAAAAALVAIIYRWLVVAALVSSAVARGVTAVVRALKSDYS
jgi:hypothetical protein